MCAYVAHPIRSSPLRIRATFHLPKQASSDISYNRRLHANWTGAVDQNTLHRKDVLSVITKWHIKRLGNQREHVLMRGVISDRLALPH